MKSFVVVFSVLAANTLRLNADFSTRVQSGLRALYTFEQQECVDNAFTDKSGVGALGLMTYNAAYESGLTGPAPASSTVKCPVVNQNSLEYRVAHVGAKFSGLDNANLIFPEYEFLESQQDISGLNLTTSVTFEMWFKPSGLTFGTRKRHVLFEIGKAGLSQETGDWRCGTDDFAVQLRYNTEIAGTLEFEVRSTENACQSRTADMQLESDSIYHLALTGEKFDLAGSFVTLWKWQVNTYGSASSFSKTDTTSILGGWTSTHTVKVGSSPGALSTAGTTMHSFPGDILLFAVYDRALTSAEIATNFGAGLPNSAPVFPVDATYSLQGGVEDGVANVTLPPQPSFYDFDVAFFGQPSSNLQMSIEKGIESGISGTLAVNGNSSLPAVFDPSGGDVISFAVDPASKDLYGRSGVFPISITDSAGAKSINSIAGTVLISASGDTVEPASSETSFSLRQFGSIQINVTGNDIDCATTQDATVQELGASSCSLFGFTSFLIESAPSQGKLYIPNDGVGSECIGLANGTEISYPYEVLTENTTPGPQSTQLCYEACGSASNPCSGSVQPGEDRMDSFQVVFVDTTGSTTQDFSVAVRSILEVLPGAHYTIEEDNEGGLLEINLEGRDFLCQDENGDSLPGAPEECSTRTLSHVIATVPPAYQGTLYSGPSTSSGVLAAGSEVAGSKVYFLPSPGYFNQDFWPLCSESLPNQNAVAQSRCQAFQNPTTVDVFKCAGPSVAENPSSCKKLGENALPAGPFQVTTVMDLSGAVMGGCSASVDQGCPVSFTYSAKLGASVSSVASSGNIWITNKKDIATISSGVQSLTNVKPDQTYELTFNGTGVSIENEADGDVRVMEVVLTTTAGLLMFENLDLADTRAVIVDGATTLATGGNLVRIAGTPSALNEYLATVKFKGIKKPEGKTISIVFSDVADNFVNALVGQVNKTVVEVDVTYDPASLDDGTTPENNEGDDTDKYMPYYIGGGVGGFVLLALVASIVFVKCCRKKAVSGESESQVASSKTEDVI